MKPLFVAALALLATPVSAETVDQVAARYKLAGEVLVARGGRAVVVRGYGTVAPAGGNRHKAGERWRLASAGGLMGTARAVFDFDRSLMTGKLLPLAELWKPEGNGSYQALGQWVFPGKLKGCAAPTRIVQREGEIYGVQARNFILPDDGVVVKGFAYDLLPAAAGCA